jgi:uncharacterized damage-inducible protein DinB
MPPLTAPQRHALIAAIKDLPDELRAAVEGLDDAQLDTHYRDGGWTARQVVHHIADSHLNAFIRMKLMLTEDRPVLKGYDQDRWAELGDSAWLQIDSSLTIIDGLHARWTSLLRSIPEEAWSRTGRHTQNGLVTLDDLLTYYGAHGRHHVAQILGLREREGW